MRTQPAIKSATLSALLIAGLLSSGACSMVQAKPLTSTIVKKDFLPPVASINPKILNQPQSAIDNSIEPVALSAIKTPAIRTTPKINTLDTDLSKQIKGEQLEGLLEIQKKVDEADLEYLWEATIDKNPVIRFSLEKLAAPPDLQTKQSSRFMTKTLNMLISGATMGSTMLPGGGMYRNMGYMAIGNALQNMASGKTPVNANSLSATEQIQLASLIDELKLKLIHSYQDYKNTLQNLAQSHEVTLKNNSLYSKALTSKNDLAIMASGTAYYQALSAETSLRQKAKRHRMELERLAGAEAVGRLALSAPVSENIQVVNTTPTTKAPPATSATNALSAIESEPYLAPKEVIGPMPLETSLKNNGQSLTESLIGPELPPPRQKAFSKKPVKPASPANEPQPMEIGPTLKESLAPMDYLFAKQEQM